MRKLVWCLHWLAVLTRRVGIWLRLFLMHAIVRWTLGCVILALRYVQMVGGDFFNFC